MVSSEYQPTKKEMLFLKYYEALIQETMHAHSHLKLWEQLVDHSKDYIDEFNEALHFFRFTIKAHLDDAILTLARILDNNEKSLNIWKFLHYAEQNIEIFSIEAFDRHIKNDQYYNDLMESHSILTLSDIISDRKKLDELKHVIYVLKKWRDKKLAHFDRRFHIKKFNISIQLQQIKGVIDALANILNRYSAAYHEKSMSINFVGEDDFMNVLDAIRFQQTEYKKQLEALQNRTSSL
ncbi:MAG: hypothetical protein JXA17_08040 [Dehalococcoidales bacterium]|nr:hypothetical protein [Dehalococcoidales bacterium]